MEGVYHVHVVKVGGRGLVCEVHRVLEREVPDREGLELRVARADAALMLMVELAQAGGHLAAAGAGRRDDDERARRLDIFVLSEALIGDYERDIRGIVGDDIVQIHRDAERLKALLELVGNGLTAVVRDDDAADIKPYPAERVDKAERIVLIGDAEVAAALAALDVVRGYGDDYLRLVLHLEQHLHLAVRREARQHAGCVEVVKELAAELQIQLAAEFGDTVAYVLRLQLYVFVVIEAYPVHMKIPLFSLGAAR